MNINIDIVMNMNIYISKDNEAYLRSLGGSMSGHINFLLEQERGEAKAVRAHIVKEGQDLGILKNPNQESKSSIPTTVDEIKKKAGIGYAVTADKKPKNLDWCKTHGMAKKFCKLMKH